MKRVHEWDQPWKKKEPGKRINQKQKKTEQIFDHQRAAMEGINQSVVFVCHKELLKPGLYWNFTVKMRFPLRYEEIKERVKAAFPELHWEDS